ncbi:MAG: amidohydrolase, partial [Aquaticitalea sp.]
MFKSYFTILSFLCGMTLFAQDYFPKNDGVKSKNTNYTAFTNAKIHVTPTQVIENGTLLIKDGKIVETGTSVAIPKNSNIVDVSGKSIYPSFIDIYSNFGIEKPKSEGSGRRSPQYDATRSGYYWNDHVMPENNAIEKFKYDSKQAEELLKAGFGVVNTHIADGIVRGTGALIALNTQGGNDTRILATKSGQFLSFEKSKLSNQSYPTSLMGAMALLRQLYYDAEWYAKGNIKTHDLSIEALNNNKGLVQIFEAGSRANDLRADKVGDLFDIQYVILGGGDEYERIDEIKAMNAPMIIPINFPEAYDVENSFLAETLSLKDLRQWNQKPTNPKVLAENGIQFALTTNDVKKIKDFSDNLMKAIKAGYPKEKAFEALTTIPAQIIGQSANIGSLKNGSQANFLITSGDIFEEKTVLFENWVQGQKNVIEDLNKSDIRGNYEFSLSGDSYKMKISGELSKLKSEITANEKTRGSKISYVGDWVNIAFTTQDSTKQEFIRLIANVDDKKNLNGKAIFPNGMENSFFAAHKDLALDEKSEDDKKKEDKKDETKNVSPLTYPNEAFGFKELPKSETLLFKNATVWTNEKDGILQNADVLIKNGKIAQIGQNLSDGN